MNQLFLQHPEWSTLKKILMFHGATAEQLTAYEASGNPVVFETNVSRPLQRLLLTLLPKQEGTGDPSPSNIRPLLPWGEVGTWLSRGTDTFVQGGIADGTGTNTASNVRIRTDFIPVSVLTESENTVEIYGTGYAENEPVIRMIHFYNESKQWLGAIRTDLILIPSFYIYQSQMPTGAEYFRVSAQKNKVGTDNISPDGIVLFTNKQSSHPVNLTGITPPVYGCELDLTTGEVWGTKGYALLNDPDKWIAVIGGNTLDFRYEVEFARKLYNDSYTGLTCSAFPSTLIPNDAYCRWAGAIAKKFGIKNGTNVATPITLAEIKTLAEAGSIAITYDIEPVLLATLTPQQISAIVGVNTVWSDADNVDVTYLKKG